MTVFAAVQFTTSGAIGPNLIQAKKHMYDAVVDTDAKCLVLPEYFACLPKDQKDLLNVAEKEGEGRIQDFLSEAAQYCDAWIVGGSIPILSTNNPEKVRNACLVYNNKGERVARYDKRHLFDGGESSVGLSYHESDVIEPGEENIVFDSPFGKIGLAVCYDLRFPETFRELREKGAQIVCVPSAFTHATGKVHWDILVGARAIENQLFMVAADQYGVGDGGLDFHGNSIIVGPWGMVLNRLEEGVGYASADVDLVRLQILREEFPVWDHRINM